MKNKSDKIPSQAAETIVLNKKQLSTPTWFANQNKGTIMTIGELSLDQLRTMLWFSIKDAEQQDKLLAKAFNALQDCMP